MTRRAMMQRQNRAISEAEARTLATWATKVAILREFFDAESQRVYTKAERHEFRLTSEPPRGTAIFAGTIDASEELWQFADRHYTIWLSDSDDPISATVPEYRKAHISTFGFAAAALVIVGGGAIDPADLRNPADDYPDRLVRLWPSPQPFVWPLDGTLTGAHLNALSGDAPGLLFEFAPDAEYVAFPRPDRFR